MYVCSCLSANNLYLIPLIIVSIIVAAILVLCSEEYLSSLICATIIYYDIAKTACQKKTKLARRIPGIISARWMITRSKR